MLSQLFRNLGCHIVNQKISKSDKWISLGRLAEMYFIWAKSKDLLMQLNQNTKRHVADWCHLQYCLSGDVFSLLNHSEKRLSLLNEKLEKLEDNQNWMWYSFWLRQNHFNALLIHVLLCKPFKRSECNLLDGRWEALCINLLKGSSVAYPMSCGKWVCH